MAVAGSTQVETDLREDLGYVQNAGAVGVSIYAAARPTPGSYISSDYTTGWIGIYPGFGQPLVQAGLITDQYGVRWFAYALQGGMTCTAGTGWSGLPSGNGCWGSYNTYAAIGQWQVFELIYYPLGGYWDVRVFAPGQYSSYTDVAKVTYPNTVELAQENAEEAYADTNDPHITMSFFHYHPQYIPQGQTAFVDWPASPGDGGPAYHTGGGVGPDNHLYVSPSTSCPSAYGAQLNELNDPRYWWTGSGGPTCSADPQF